MTMQIVFSYNKNNGFIGLLEWIWLRVNREITVSESESYGSAE